MSSHVLRQRAKGTDRPLGEPRRRPGALRLRGRVLALVALLSWSVACEDRVAYTAPPPPEVTVAKPVKRTITDYIELTGTTEASNQVELRARVEGYLDQVLFKDGDRVQEGDLLFTIERAPYEAALQRAEANVARARAKRNQSELTANRFIEARKTNAVSQQDVDEAVAQEAVDEADVLARKAMLTQAQLDLSYTEVRAPFSGRIGRRLKDPGNLVGSGEDTVIAVMNQRDPIYVYFTINEEDLLRAVAQRAESPETTARARSLPVLMGLADEEGYPHEGTFDFANISLDSGTGTLLLRAVFPNPDDRILAGLFARIRVPLTELQDVVLVPQEAVAYDQLGAHVLVVDGENTVERRAVEVGPSSGPHRVITRGLAGNESVVVNGLLRAIPGRTVTPVVAGSGPGRASTEADRKG